MLFLVANLDASFEIPNNLPVINLTRLIKFVRDDEREPRFGKSTRLASHDGNLDEGIVGIWEQNFIVL